MHKLVDGPEHTKYTERCKRFRWRASLDNCFRSMQSLFFIGRPGVEWDSFWVQSSADMWTVWQLHDLFGIVGAYAWILLFGSLFVHRCFYPVRRLRSLVCSLIVLN